MVFLTGPSTKKCQPEKNSQTTLYIGQWTIMKISNGINIFQISSSWPVSLSATVPGLGKIIESLKFRIFRLLNQKNIESLEFWIKRRINLGSINPEVDWVADIDGRTFIIFLGLSRPPPSLHIFSTQAGGVMAISASQFESVDGFSNGFLTHRIICQQNFPHCNV